MLSLTPLSAAVALALTWVPPTPAAVRAAAERAMPLLADAAATHADRQTCFGCHNQAFPAVAFAAARGRGFAVDRELVAGQIEHVTDFVDRNLENFRSGKGTGGQVDTAGWVLDALDRLGHKPDDRTAAVVEYLVKKDAGRGHYRGSSDRPPSEASQFSANYVAARGLNVWVLAEKKDRAGKRIEAVRKWVLATKPADTEDRVYRLLLLREVQADDAAVRAAAAELAGTQQADGGWGQRDGMASDAYATGTALFALFDAGGVSPDAPAFRRGLGFLVRTQRPDGSWFVKSRSKPFQPYYEGGFPYGKDQFISSTASSWAAAALWRAVPAGE